MNALYRGKRIDTGEWVYGIPYQLTKGAWCDPIENGTYIQSSKLLENGEIILTGVEEVDPTTVGQYTGLKDKNGVRIFQGAECKVCWQGKIFAGVVEYSGQIAAFKIDLAEVDKCILFLDLFQSQNRGEDAWAEVIGNIHDKEANQ